MKSKRENVKCCVIIVTYNGMEWIEKCLSNLFKSTFSAQVVVVDNHSSDGTAPFIQKEFRQVHLLENNDNLGFGAANNLALKEYYSRGYDYFFLLNQDAYVEASCIGALVGSMVENPTYGIMSPIHMNGAGNGLDHSFFGYMRREFSGKFLSDYKSNSLLDGIYDVPFVNAAAWMISRECLRRVGLFHPLFFHYGEDDNFGQRTNLLGLKIGVLAQAYIYHDQEQRESNVYKDDPRIMFKWKTMINMLNYFQQGSDLRKVFNIFGDLCTMSVKRPLWDILPFVIYGCREWRQVYKQVRSFDNSLLKIE